MPVVLAVGLVLGVGLALVNGTTAGACSMGPISEDFTGRAVAKTDRTVTYAVDAVRPTSPGEEPRPVASAGGRVTVRYDDSTRLINVGERYRVRGWPALGHVGSQIAYDFHGNCGTGVGTTRPDGSFLGPPRPGVLRWAMWIGGAIALVVCSAVVAKRADARYARRHELDA